MNRQRISIWITLLLIPMLCLTPLAYAEANAEQPSGQIEQSDTCDQMLMPRSEEEEMQKAEPIEISDVYLKDRVNCFFLVMDESPATLPLPSIAYDYDSTEPFAISWRFASLDNHAPGWQELIGDVILPEGYVFAWDPLTVSVFVIVYEPGKPPIVEADDVVYSINLSIGPITVPVGTSREELQQYFEYATETAYIYFDFDDSKYSVTYECPLFFEPRCD